MQLVDVRCPLPRADGSDKACNRLCVRVTAGSAGQAHCPRHDKTFDFQIDDHKSFDGIIRDREANQSGQPARAEHPTV